MIPEPLGKNGAQRSSVRCHEGFKAELLCFVVALVDCERHLLGIVSRGDVLKGLRQLYARRQKSNLDKKEHVPLKHGAS